MSGEEWIEPRSNRAKRIFQEFPGIPTRWFGKKDFRMLVKVLSQVFAEWEGIGLCLEIVQNTMSNLGDKWKRQSNRGLISILDEWMKGHYEEKKLYPCWKSVVYIVADDLGGRNAAAARIIAKNWKVYEDDPFFGCEEAKRADSSPLYTLDSKNRFITRLYTDYLHEVGQWWYEIGVLLGVPFNKLETIDTKHDKLMEVIDAWIDLYDDPATDYLPAPTIQILVDAVAHAMGGNNQGLAIRIADNVKVSCDVQQAQQDSRIPAATHIQPQAQAQQQPETPVTGVTSGEIQTYSASMTVDELCSWLLSNNMTPEDCKIFRENNVNGAAFGYCSEDDWKEFGISFGGKKILKNRIMKLVSSSADPGQLNGSSSNGSPNGSTNGSSNGTGTASPQGNSTTSDFSAYVSRLPASARPHLEQQVDWNSDLIVIAHDMLNWEENLRTHLGLTDVDVHDIKASNSNNPILQRREALRRWRNNKGLRATYGNLLELFVKAGHSQCADAVCEVLRKK